MNNDDMLPFRNPEPLIHHALALWAALCAEHTLFLFEQYAPNDMRPRHALETVRAWVRDEAAMVTCRRAAFAAHAAAREATDPIATAAARATGQAAAVAHMWNHAPHAAEYAAKAASLAAPQTQAQAIRERERDWQWDHLQEDLRSWGFPKGKYG
jgi:hypothetical protein